MVARSVTAIIPARLASTRFPGKVLAAETGTPLVQHVVERARLAESVERVVVASEDREIAEALAALGTEVIVTGPATNGTERVAIAARELGDPEIVVNVQGDEPEIEPAVIDAAVSALERDDRAWIATVATPFRADEDRADPNVVKVVRNRDGNALYFSRAPIPYEREVGAFAANGIDMLRHVGIYAYRKVGLARYRARNAADPSDRCPLEQVEQLEQLWWLWQGVSDMPVALCASSHAGIDTPAQYAAFVERYRSSSR